MTVGTVQVRREQKGFQMNQITGVMGANESDILAEQGCEAGHLRQSLKVQRDRNAGVGFAPLDLAEMAPATETGEASHGLERKAEVTTNVGERGHPQKFAHAEQIGKANVRHHRTDMDSECLHIPNMASKPRKARHDLYPTYREKSGWFLAAWRDHAGLTLEDLADELGMSKGYVSDLETGAQRDNRAPTRFNRDLVEKASKAVGTTGGRLIDLNPFTLTEQAERLNAAVAQLDEAGQAAMLEMAERWLGRTGTSG